MTTINDIYFEVKEHWIKSSDVNAEMFIDFRKDNVPNKLIKIPQSSIFAMDYKDLEVY